MKIPEPTKGGDFAPTPAGQYTAICCRVVDLGTQRTEGQYGVKHVHKVLIGWEIPEVRINVEGEDKPSLHQERYTLSMHEKAHLRHLLESWRGVQFQPEDFGNWDMARLIGVPALMQISHNQGSNGRVYANIQSIMRSPIKRDDWPKLEGEPIHLDLDAYDPDEYEKLSEYWQNLIAESPEFKALSGYQIPEQAGDAPDMKQDIDDGIPF
jgi:hypothetical protein